MNVAIYVQKRKLLFLVSILTLKVNRNFVQIKMFHRKIYFIKRVLTVFGTKENSV